MTPEEATEKIKTDSSLAAKIQQVNAEATGNRLDKLYFIYLNEDEAVWGARLAGSLSGGLFTQSLQEKLALFLKEDVGLDYLPDQIKILDSALNEVDYVLAHSDLGAYIQSHGGSCEVLDANENTGVVTISLVGTCSTCSSSMITMKMGVEKFLEEMLPWVKKVETPDEPQDPDFGITKVLEDAEKEAGNGSSMISEGSPGEGGESNDR